MWKRRKKQPLRRKEELSPHRLLQFKTLFGRLLATYLAVVICLLVLVSLLTTQVTRSYWIERKTEDLFESTETIRSLFEENYASNGIGDGLMRDISHIASYDNTNIWIVDAYDIIWYNVAGSSALTAYEQKLMDNKDEMLEEALNGEKNSIVLYDDSMYAVPVISVSVPLEQGDRVVGAIFVHAKVTEFEQAIRIFFSQLWIAGFVTTVIAAALIFITARQIERPLAQINQAARELARGNFDRRVSVQEENEVGQLADTFNMMAEELQKYENTRTSFVANVSHELRSPLTSIQGFIQGMLDDTIEEKDRKQYLEIVLSETKRLNVLIRDLLDLAKIESGQFPLHIRELDINELIRQCLIRFLTKIEEKDLEVSVDIPEQKDMVFADEDRMTQVLTNLIDNAVKFCEPGGRLKIWTYQAEERIHVNISNSGSVIPEEDLPYVFDRFFKVDKSHNRKAPGTGIGLSIVKNIVQQHGEKIWVSSKKSTGTVFTFTLRQKPPMRREKKRPEREK